MVRYVLVVSARQRPTLHSFCRIEDWLKKEQNVGARIKLANWKKKPGLFKPGFRCLD